MSHIRVDDAMHRRIMDAVSEAIEQGAEANTDDILSTRSENPHSGAEVQPLRRNDEEESGLKTPIKRKAKVSVIKIISIAAAAILVAGGAVLFAKRTKGSTQGTMKAVNEVAYATTAAEIDSVVGAEGNRNYFAATKKGDVAADSSNNSNKTVKGVMGITSGKDNGTENDDEKAPESRMEETAEGVDGGVRETAPTEREASAQSKKDIRDVIPFNVRSVGTGSVKGNIKTTVYAGEKGEKMILFTAKSGTDIVKAYYPKFKGIPALLQTEGGQVFNGIDTAAGKKEQVNPAGPFDAVTWTKDGNSYMLMFNTKTDVQVFIAVMETI